MSMLYYKKRKYILCNIDFGVFILFPKYVVNVAFWKQNNTPYFLGHLIYCFISMYYLPHFPGQHVYVV